MEMDSSAKVLAAAKTLESCIDEALDQLNNISGDAVLQMRRERLEKMKIAERNKQKWLSNGHGVYGELSSDNEFFEAGRRSERLVVQFYKDKNEISQIMDSHLAKLAQKHMSCRFCQVDVSKCPFTVTRLNVRVMPTLVLVLNGQTVGFCRGFDDFGGVKNFPTEAIERRLAMSGLIDFPDEHDGLLAKNCEKSKNIKRGMLNDSQSDSD